MLRRSKPLLSPAFLLIAACAGSPLIEPTRPAPSGPIAPIPILFERSAPAKKPPKPEVQSTGGMWLPSQLPEHAATLKKLGLEIDPKKLADPLAHPLGAVVSLGGCSASFVSSEGLIITNHHCVTGALGYNSTPSDNLLHTGYLAKTRSEEKWAGPTARVYVTRSFEDVTQTVRAGLEKIKDPKARHEAIETRQKELVARCEKKPAARCEVASMFGGAQYLLIEKLEIRDVRLVYAPHEGIGNFGGEIDNWRWPRHGADFSFLRAYVGKDGAPADHSPDNVPYQPRMHLEIAGQPLGQGDLVLVAGYPGRTMRLATAGEISEASDWYYPKRIALFEDYLALIQKLGKDDADVAVKARPLERGLANALTYTKGALEGLTKGGVGDRGRKRETELGEWTLADPARKERFGHVLADLRKIDEKRVKYRELGFALSELERLVSLYAAAATIVRMAEERPKPDAQRKPEYQERNWQRLAQDQEALEKRYSRKLDRALLELALTRIARRGDPAAKKAVLGRAVGKPEPTEAEIAQAADRLYSGTSLEDTKKRIELLKTAKLEALRASKDPLIQLALGLRPFTKARDDRADAEAGEMALVRPLYVAALREHATEALAPDANGTLRVTYGTVRGYSPAPGAKAWFPFSTIEELEKKVTGQEPFDPPPRLVERAKASKESPWVDATLGTLPVDFLADCDITGGNSGSPTLDARGKLVGLAFDGNYEAMASDWVFMPAITRSIHVDIRYVLWVMDAVDGAHDLLREMGRKPATGGPS